jgi:hypothetical protein
LLSLARNSIFAFCVKRIVNDEFALKNLKRLCRGDRARNLFRRIQFASSISRQQEYFQISIHWFATALCAVAFIAMLRFKIDIIPVVIGAGVVGLGYKFLLGF